MSCGLLAIGGVSGAQRAALTHLLAYASMGSPLEKSLVRRHAAACFNLHMWVPGGPIFRQSSFVVTWISVPGPKHTFLDVAL